MPLPVLQPIDLPQDAQALGNRCESVVAEFYEILPFHRAARPLAAEPR